MDNYKVCVLNYGAGNVKSVYNMLLTMTDNVKISNAPEVIQCASHIILPGVGSFGSSMEKIKNNIPLEVLSNEVLEKKKPFLGICVGMQVLADIGFEFGNFQGLGWISGEVHKLNSLELPLPHIGWNNIEIIKDNPILSHFTSSQDFYFVHSYIFKPGIIDFIVAETDYGEKFPSIINKGNIYGVQFHPEKSQKAGKILIENFLRLYI
ncbi:MAG: imidazole glycerol phosphate synthase subunit HisH [Candidatus Eremiobacterota bacterium]